jgi:hypothetical protein
LYTRKAAILLKQEVTEGTDPTPTGASNALLVSELSIDPLQIQTVSLDYIRPYYGSSPSIIVAQNAQCSFTIDLAGSSAAGTAPPWEAALLSCGFAATNVAAAVTGTATAGSSTTITLAVGASSVDGYYVGSKITRTAGTNFGSGIITGYVGSTRVATVAGMALAPDNTSAYSIEAHNQYKPLTDSPPSCTIYFYRGGVLHKLTGCRGTVSLELSSGARPSMKFTFTGVYNAVTDAAVASTTLTAWQIPPAVITSNTSGYFFGKALTGGASGLQLSKFMMDMANDIKFRQLIGTSGVVFTGRAPKGSISFEMPLVAELDVFGTVQGNTTGVVAVRNGSTAGNITTIVLPKGQMQNPKYSDSDGVVMMDADLIALPNSGNDEVVLTVS